MHATTSAARQARRAAALNDASNPYAGKTVADLKALLRARGLPVSGVKATLLERLEASDGGGGACGKGGRDARGREGDGGGGEGEAYEETKAEQGTQEEESEEAEQTELKAHA